MSDDVAEADGSSAAETDGSSAAETNGSGTAVQDGAPGEASAVDGSGAAELTGGVAGVEADSDSDAETGAPSEGVAEEAASATTVREMRLTPTNHWVGIAAITFLTAGLGVMTRSRPLFLAAVVGVGYLAYANATEAPDPSLAVTLIQTSSYSPGVASVSATVRLSSATVVAPTSAWFTSRMTVLMRSSRS